MFAVSARDRINRLGPLLPQCTILGFRENVGQLLKMLMLNYNVVVGQTSFGGFRNTTDDLCGITAKPTVDTTSSIDVLRQEVCNRYGGKFLGSHCD